MYIHSIPLLYAFVFLFPIFIVYSLPIFFLSLPLSLILSLCWNNYWCLVWKCTLFLLLPWIFLHLFFYSIPTSQYLFLLRQCLIHEGFRILEFPIFQFFIYRLPEIYYLFWAWMNIFSSFLRPFFSAFIFFFLHKTFIFPPFYALLLLLLFFFPL